MSAMTPSVLGMDPACDERLMIRPPPVLERADGSGALVALLPALGSLGSVGLVVSMTGTGPRQLLAVAAFLLASVGFAIAQLDRQRRVRLRAARAERADYRDYLAEVRAQVRRLASAQREAALSRHPPPSALATLAAAGQLPRTGPVVRYGTRPGPLSAELVAPAPTSRADPSCLAQAVRLVAVHGTLELPATIDLESVSVITAPAATARAIVCAAAPEAFVVVLASPARRSEWEWTKWLPRRGFSLEGLPAGRALVVVDGEAAQEASDRHGPATVPPGPGITMLVVGGELSADHNPLPGVADECSVALAESFARRLTPAATAGETIDPTPAWSPRSGPDRLRVPIGTDDEGVPVLLDLKEAAEGGVGPHGLLIGATGSGKSELLRTLVLRLALAHPPSELSLVLVDFKGGAAFDGLATLPHVAALVTNLDGEQALLQRMEDALAGELTRRQ